MRRPSMHQEYVYNAFNRFWHWAQASLILFLGATGFEIHGSFEFFGYAQAVRYHNAAAVGFLVLIAFAVFWHFTTDAWKQYLPTLTNLQAQAQYYVFGIFRNAPHPTKKTALSKLNPLQKLVYLGLKLLVIPVLAMSGVLYMFYRYPHRFDVVALKMEGLRAVAMTHTFSAFMVLTFLIAHVYLITTGHTLTSNLKAMITGYEELEDEATANHDSQSH
jgi:thiosulfate reductase cytochrome b subunit